ncbi:inositol/phosphatidylinositol phosphatase [Naematelia encephala]|uniref:Inositol/phosphatidylinositol phosphatase n=1 Tax=Naematelia encephala TaxID=71784 RepID=A0A1Y2B1P2_9TREE|nr:inositol/phosphatidylinositol phosphatase [Naematelia encephala]
MSEAYNCLPLHETLNLYVSPTAYVFEPASSSLSHTADGPSFVNEKDVRETLYVDRRTGRMALNEASGVPLGREKVITCYGIIGVISLATTDFLLIVTARTPSCRLLSQPVYLATDYRLLPLSPLSTSSAILDHPVEKELISLVEQGLRSARLWFSYGLDLTNTLQRQKQLEDAGHGPNQWPMWKRADERFFWNRFLAGKLIDMTENGGVDLSRFILPIVYGSVELRSATINNRDLLFLLIARRSRQRAGTRYFSRGIDAQGNTSNFNETEQIILLDPLPDNGEPIRRGRVDGRERLSFVQTRGSVPLFWAEINNLRYKPDLQIMDIPETASALRTHLHQMIATYGTTYLVNLVNHKGHEHPVKDAFERNMAQAKATDPLIAEKAHYVYFDFHTECKGMRFDRISVLIDRLAPALDDMGWFHAVAPPVNFSGNQGELKVLQTQTGVVRSNCMDCLDRTNVSQSALGKWALNKQLRSAGVLSIKETVDDHEEFISIFRNVWADHGNTVSLAYAGTGALKTDFTRTGKRSKEGALQDGYNSIMRYIRNNFFDGDRQDAFDILTGAWVAQKGGIPPLTDTRPLIMRSMPYVLAFALTMIFAAVTLPRSSDYSISSFIFLWLFLAFVSGSYIWGNGTSYVSWPRLNPPVHILSYNGPGVKGTVRGRGMSLSGVIPKVGRRSATSAGRKGEEVELGRRKGALID